MQVVVKGRRKRKKKVQKKISKVPLKKGPNLYIGRRGLDQIKRYAFHIVFYYAFSKLFLVTMKSKFLARKEVS